MFCLIPSVFFFYINNLYKLDSVTFINSLSLVQKYIYSNSINSILFWIKILEFLVVKYGRKANKNSEEYLRNMSYKNQNRFCSFIVIQKWIGGYNGKMLDIFTKYL